MTGATGFLGGHFLYFRSQGPGRFLVMSRDTHPQQAELRLRKNLETFAASYETTPETLSPKFRVSADSWSRISMVRGDLSKENLGISEAEIEELQKKDIDEVWHFAANLHFEDAKEADILRDNVEGTLKLLEVSKKIKAKKFIYVSTAYSAGRKGGLVDQTLHSNEGPFSNAYEKSKCWAENHVVDFCTRENLEYVILRPSIVLGPLTTHSAGGSDSGIYGFVSSLHRIKDKIKNAGGRLTLIGDSKNSLNCIPVDQFVKNVLYLAEEQFTSGSIFHITAQQEAHVGLWFNMLAKIMRLKEIRFVLPELKVSHTPLEKMIDRATLFYSSYLSHRRRFVTKLPFPTGVSSKDMESYLRVYLRQLESKAEVPLESAPIQRPPSALSLE